jgi:hypothetical protein
VSLNAYDGRGGVGLIQWRDHVTVGDCIQIWCQWLDLQGYRGVRQLLLCKEKD